MVKKSDNDDDNDDDDDNNNDIDDNDNNEGLKFGATEKNSKAADFFLGKNVAEASPEQGRWLWGVRRSFPDWKNWRFETKKSFWLKIIFHNFDEL